MQNYDALIVGGGPVGSAVARELARAGHSVLEVEEHAVVGDPVQCAGLFTPRVFEEVPADLSHLHLSRIRKANVFSPGGARVRLESRGTQAIACDRAGFDQALAALALAAGAELRLGTKVIGAERGSEKVRVKLRLGAREETVGTRLLVGADGAQSRVAKWFDLFQPRQFVSLHGAQMSGLVGLDEEAVEMWLGSERAPGFFSYIVPTGQDTGKVEVGVWNAPRPAQWYFEQMWRDPLVRVHLGDAKAVFTISATIPFGPAKKSVAERVMLVGDAAGQAKPTSGGGVYTGLHCAAILARVAHDALDDDDLSAKRLSPYHEEWYGTIGRELAIGLRLRHAFLQLKDDQIDDLWTRLSKPEVLALLNAVGDIDYPSKLAFALLREEPGLFKFAPPLLKGFLTAAAPGRVG